MFFEVDHMCFCAVLDAVRCIAMQKSAHFSSFHCLFHFFSTYTPGPATDSAANTPLSVVLWWPV